MDVDFRIQTKHLVCNEEDNHHEVFVESSLLKASLSLSYGGQFYLLTTQCQAQRIKLVDTTRKKPAVKS